MKIYYTKSESGEIKQFTWSELIDFAEDTGYSPGEIVTTSGSAKWLRNLGYEVGNISDLSNITK